MLVLNHWNICRVGMKKVYALTIWVMDDSEDEEASKCMNAAASSISADSLRGDMATLYRAELKVLREVSKDSLLF